MPYPWVLPEDPPIRSAWTADEDAVVLGAPSALVAYDVYLEAFGDVRSYSSVYRHWQYRRTHPPHTIPWSEDEEDIIECATSPSDAVCRYHAEYGTRRTDRAVRDKYGRLKH